jgi:membrane protein
MSPRIPQHPSWIGRLWRYVSHDIWLVEIHALPRFKALVARTSQVVILTVRGVFGDDCMRQAAALTYLTVFSMVPLLAFVFAMGKAFGAYDREALEPVLSRVFGQVDAEDAAAGATDPAGPEGTAVLRQVVDQILGFAERTDLGALGVFGALFLLYSLIKMMGAVEHSFNEIWGVKRARSLVRKVSDYLAIVIVSPILLITGGGLTAMVRSKRLPFFGELGFDVPWIATLIPLVVIWLGMSFLVFTLPNTRVRLVSALIGGLVAGLLWQGIQGLHVSTQVGLASWNPVYSSFAAFPLLLLWIYLSWLILLMGAEIAFAHQNVSVYRSIVQTGRIDESFRERVAVRLAGRIAHAFLRGEPPPEAGALATELGIAPRAALDVLDTLVAAHLLARTPEDDEAEAYLPARDPDTITVLDVLQAIRHEANTIPPPPTSRLDERVDRILAAFDHELRRSLENHTLRELAQTMAEERAEEGREEREEQSPSRAAESPSS